jgi:LmbE family N-acetylglucosaminyl deacetylase
MVKAGASPRSHKVRRGNVPQVATVVFFHAHPDDECMATAGTMAQLTSEGHRVVLVTATDGAQGEVPDGFLDPGEDLASRRRQELEKSCEVLGVERLELLGYGDSGMIGTPANDDPDCFWQTDVEGAAERLAAILREEEAEVLTCYDEHGGYGHPDHIQVHRVGLRAAELAGVPRCYMSTINRDRVVELISAARELGLDLGGPEEDFDPQEFGVEEARITTEIDVSGFLELKRRAMEAHASQIRPDTFPLSLPPEAFGAAFGTEWYMRVGATRVEPLEATLLDGTGGSG